MSIEHIMDQIPPELWGEIFYHCSTAYADAPLILSCVSSSFRQIVWTTPTIWQRLQLRIPKLPAVEESRWAQEKCRLWFRLAGICPMNVSIDIVGWTNADGHLMQEESALVELSTNAHRIRRLFIDAKNQTQAEDFVAAVFKFPAASPATLRNLTIDIRDAATRAQVTSNTDPVNEETSPLVPLDGLQSMKFRNFTLPLLPSTSYPALQTLILVNPLRAQPLSLDDIFDALNSTPCLKRFELNARIRKVVHAPQVDLGSDQRQVETIQLPMLSTLSLSVNHLPKLLDRLVLPQLRTLHLADLDGRRLGACEELGKALRGLIVRMHLAVTDGHSSETRDGLDHSLMPPHHTPPSSSQLARGIVNLRLSHIPIRRAQHDEEALWEWCFKRMNRLRNLQVCGVDVEEVTELLLQERFEVCPVLERVTVSWEGGCRQFDKLARLVKERPEVIVTYAEVEEKPYQAFHFQEDVEDLEPRLDGKHEKSSSSNVLGLGFGSRFDLTRRLSRGHSS